MSGVCVREAESKAAEFGLDGKSLCLDDRVSFGAMYPEFLYAGELAYAELGRSSRYGSRTESSVKAELRSATGVSLAELYLLEG